MHQGDQRGASGSRRAQPDIATSHQMRGACIHIALVPHSAARVTSFVLPRDRRWHTFVRNGETRENVAHELVPRSWNVVFMLKMNGLVPALLVAGTAN
jgi:hypothetical protein